MDGSDVISTLPEEEGDTRLRDLTKTKKGKNKTDRWEGGERH